MNRLCLKWLGMLIFRDKLSSLLMKMPDTAPKSSAIGLRGKRKLRPFAASCGLLIALGALTGFASSAANAQQSDPAPVVVQPGAPGKPSRKLPPSTTAKLPPRSPAEVEFMQGMIVHHLQAVEMTALIP